MQKRKNGYILIKNHKQRGYLRPLFIYVLVLSIKCCNIKDEHFLVVQCTSKYKIDTVGCKRRISKGKSTTLDICFVLQVCKSPVIIQ